MSLFQSLVQAVRSWRRRRGGNKAPKRAGVALERLDHRQLLSVTFSGNVTTDFPVGQPGFISVNESQGIPVQHPIIPPDLASIIKVSGFDVSGIRLSYDPVKDELDLGLEQPNNQKDGRPVLAGDADNNGNAGTVDPAVSAVDPNFDDFPDLGYSETLGAFLDLNLNDTQSADLVAGFSNDNPVAQKNYQVADALVNPSVRIPAFGNPRPQNTGGFFLFNSPDTPSFEFAIKNFSQVYLEKTGQPLTADSRIAVGAFGGSVEGGISEAFFPPTTVRLGDFTEPNTCPVCPPAPPASPPVIINIHENRHINTAHETRVRAYVFGSSGFDVSKIDQASVRLGGATPYDSVTRDVNHDGWPDRTFFFRGNEINLPSGFTQATLTGNLTDGTTFSSTVGVFNRDSSFYSPADLAVADRRQEARAARADRIAGGVAATVAAERADAQAPAGPTVKINRRPARPQTVAIPRPRAGSRNAAAAPSVVYNGGA